VNAKTPREAELEQQVTELLEQRVAISEVLHAIASSPHDLQPVFDAILVNATRLCRAAAGAFRLREDKGFRLVAMKVAPDVLHRWSPPTLIEHGSGYGLLAVDKSPVHIPDLAAHDLYRRGDPNTVALVDGLGGEQSCSCRC